MAIQKTQVDVCAEDLTPMRVLAYLSDTDKRFRLHFLTESEAAGDWSRLLVAAGPLEIRAFLIE